MLTFNRIVQIAKEKNHYPSITVTNPKTKEARKTLFRQKLKLKQWEAKAARLVKVVEAYDYNFMLLQKAKTNSAEKSHHQLVEDLLNREGCELRDFLKIRNHRNPQGEKKNDRKEKV
jgi:hypothetical protein